MIRKRALFVSLHALDEAGNDTRLLESSVDLLRDYAAAGYQVIIVTDDLELSGRCYRSRIELLAALRTDWRRHYAVPVSDVLHTHSASDPAPFWDAARRFNLSLTASTFISYDGRHAAAARNAGVGRTEDAVEIFSQAA